MCWSRSFSVAAVSVHTQIYRLGMTDIRLGGDSSSALARPDAMWPARRRWWQRSLEVIWIPPWGRRWVRRMWGSWCHCVVVVSRCSYADYICKCTSPSGCCVARWFRRRETLHCSGQKGLVLHPFQMVWRPTHFSLLAPYLWIFGQVPLSKAARIWFIISIWHWKFHPFLVGVGNVYFIYEHSFSSDGSKIVSANNCSSISHSWTLRNFNMLWAVPLKQ